MARERVSREVFGETSFWLGAQCAGAVPAAAMIAKMAPGRDPFRPSRGGSVARYADPCRSNASVGWRNARRLAATPATATSAASDGGSNSQGEPRGRAMPKRDPSG